MYSCYHHHHHHHDYQYCATILVAAGISLQSCMWPPPSLQTIETRLKFKITTDWTIKGIDGKWTNSSDYYFDICHNNNIWEKYLSIVSWSMFIALKNGPWRMFISITWLISFDMSSYTKTKHRSWWYYLSICKKKLSDWCMFNCLG